MRKDFTLVPGVALCFAIMIAAGISADLLGSLINRIQGITDGASPVSSIFMAVVLGLLIRNFMGIHPYFRNGVIFSIHYLLKAGIILLGIRLSFFDVIKLGTWGLPIILVCLATGLFVTLLVTHKMRQPHRLGVLTAVGTSICGITAIMGTAPGIRANDEEIAYAIANVTLFGIAAMFAYPYLAHALFANDPVRAGLFLGTAIHETSQVTGAALIYDQLFSSEKVVDVATITKLTRNTLLILVVPLMSFYYLRVSDQEGTKSRKKISLFQLIPFFVLGFLAMAALRTIGDSGIAKVGLAFNFFYPEQWKYLWTGLNTLGSKYLLGIAMAGIGLSTSTDVFRGLGIKPFYVGIVAATAVSVVSLLMVYLLGGFIKM